MVELSIDLKLLISQKNEILELREESNSETIDGIVNLLESIIDQKEILDGIWDDD